MKKKQEEAQLKKMNGMNHVKLGVDDDEDDEEEEDGGNGGRAQNEGRRLDGCERTAASRSPIAALP